MTDKTLEALERLMPLLEKSMRELAFTAEKAGEVTADMNTLRAALAAPSAGPPAPIAGVTAIYCGWGCSCVTQCGDTYDYAGQPKPPLRPAAPAQPPSAEAEPVRRLVDAAMAVISRHDEWVRQMPAGAFDDPLSVSLAALHDAAETVGISLDIVRRYAAPPL